LGRGNFVSGGEWSAATIKLAAARRPLSLREVVDSIAVHTGTLLEIVSYNVEVGLLLFVLFCVS
jgi:hypothetical protein